MPLDEGDLSFLFDMLECCTDVLDFTSNVSYEQYAADKMRRLATERRLETLGEAANHVSLVCQAKSPDIDWSRIIGLRNKLAHDYGEVLAERVWQITQNHIPTLRARLTVILSLASDG